MWGARGVSADSLGLLGASAADSAGALPVSRTCDPKDAREGAVAGDELGAAAYPNSDPRAPAQLQPLQGEGGRGGHVELFERGPVVVVRSVSGAREGAEAGQRGACGHRVD